MDSTYTIDFQNNVLTITITNDSKKSDLWIDDIYNCISNHRFLRGKIIVGVDCEYTDDYNYVALLQLYVSTTVLIIQMRRRINISYKMLKFFS